MGNEEFKENEELQEIIKTLQNMEEVTLESFLNLFMPQESGKLDYLFEVIKVLKKEDTLKLGNEFLKNVDFIEQFFYKQM